MESDPKSTNRGSLSKVFKCSALGIGILVYVMRTGVVSHRKVAVC